MKSVLMILMVTALSFSADNREIIQGVDPNTGEFITDQDADADQLTTVLGFQPWRDASGWANDFYGPSNDTFVWSSTRRTVNGEAVADAESLTLKRRTPAPSGPASAAANS